MNRISWMNSRRWRLEEVDIGDDQYPVESRFAVRHTPPDEQDPRFDRRRSVSSVFRYATPLPINRTPVSTVGGPTEVCFLRFVVCKTPPDEQDPVLTVVGRTQGRFLRSVVRQASFRSAVPSKPVGSR